MAETGRDPRDPLELYGAASCPYTADLRDELQWQGREFVYFDVELDAAAHARMAELTGGGRTVPVLVSAGEVVQVGYQGRGCLIGAAGSGSAAGSTTRPTRG